MLKRTISKGNLLLLTAGGMIGSGWLFSPFISAKIAGPYALLAWIIAFLCIVCIALPLCELGALFPMAGGMVNYPGILYGPGMSFMFGWILWIGYVVCSPIEVQAIIQYASYFFPALVKTDFHLSLLGFIAAVVLLFLMFLINALGVKLLTSCNRFFSIFKFIVPLVTIFAFWVVAPSATHHVKWLIPSRVSDWQHVFMAIAYGGIAFSFVGFQSGLFMGGEVKQPHQAIPISLLGSVGLGFALYFLLQWSFLIAVPDTALTSGWSHLSFVGHESPMVGLALICGLGWIAFLLMIDASISPLGTTLVYTAINSRILYAMGLNKDLPKFLSRLNRFKVPGIALGINFILGILSFIPFSGWQNMVVFFSSCSILSYMIGPVCLNAFRTHHPEVKTVFRLKYVHFWCFISFYASMLMLLCCGFDILNKLLIAIVLGILFYWRSKCSLKTELPWVLWILQVMMVLLTLAYLENGTLRLFPYDLILLLPMSYGLLKQSARFANPIKTEDLPQHVRLHLKVQPL
jgi:amino acid transporter